jgi:FlaA1/EpsC-like NDP-sugar epimerase
MEKFFFNKVILITGAAGFVGQGLVEQLIAYEPAEIRAIDNNETELFILGEKYPERVTAYLGDVRDGAKLQNVCAGVDILIHTAAFKHVGLSEYNPFDVVQTNILGVRNVIQAAMHNRVKKVLFTSSDKAVNPTSVMGTSKLMGERLMTSANIVNFNGHQVFSSVRFGNVIGSRGSVVPIFVNQICQKRSVTITDKNMTRFFITLSEAAQLVLDSCILACGGEVFVKKMPVVCIVDLAQAIVELLAPVYNYDPKDIEYKFIGARPGEKLYEELITSEEVNRSIELPEVYAILPALKGFYYQINYTYNGKYRSNPITQPYISSFGEPMTVPEIKAFLVKHKILKELVGECFVSPRLLVAN